MRSHSLLKVLFSKFLLTSSLSFRSSSTNHILSNESLTNEVLKSNPESDYYMTAPTQMDAQQPPVCLEARENDYLLVDELRGGKQSPREEHNCPGVSSAMLFNNLDMQKSEFKVVQSTGSLTTKLSSATGYKPIHTQYYSPVNSSFVELPDPLEEELNEGEQVDEYIQVELAEKKSSRLEAISSEPSSEASGVVESGAAIDEDAEERDYIGVESFSSPTNAEASENFEISNLSPISSTSCNMLSRVKTFSTSSNTSANELHSLGTSPSLISNSFYNQTPVNHAKEEVYKLENVKSYFQTPEDGLDYIRPARAYSIGTRYERPKLSSLPKLKHCPVMTKSKSSLISANRKGKRNFRDAFRMHFECISNAFRMHFELP